MGRTHTRKSLDRGFRCGTTGGFGGRGRDHVHCLRGVVGATIVISRSSPRSRIKVGGAISVCFRRSSIARACGLIAAIEDGSLGGLVDQRSPLNTTVFKRGIKSHYRIRMGSGCSCFIRVGHVIGAVSSNASRLQGFWRRRGGVGMSRVLGGGRIAVSYRVFPPGRKTRLRGCGTVTTRVTGLGPTCVDYACKTANKADSCAMRVTSTVGSCKIPTVTRLAYISSAERGMRAMVRRLGRHKVRGVLTLHKSVPAGASFPLPSRCRRTVRLVHRVGRTKSFYVNNTYCPRKRPRTTGVGRSLSRLGRGISTNYRCLAARVFFSGGVCCHFLCGTLTGKVSIPIATKVVPIAGTTRIGEAVSLAKGLIPTGFLDVISHFKSGPTTVGRTKVTCTARRVVSLVTGKIGRVRVCSVGGPSITTTVVGGLSRVCIERRTWR